MGNDEIVIQVDRWSGGQVDRKNLLGGKVESMDKYNMNLKIENNYNKSSAIGWTKEQMSAIQARDCSLLVAAAAGAGKTAVLVERIIRRILDKVSSVDIDKLLVVTFTNAAATEMRERISDAIDNEIERNPDSSILKRQNILIHKANITTIHSFCLDVIRNNFHHIDLDPGFRIADETEALLLKMEAMEEMFEDKYGKANEDENFYKLVECYSGNRDDKKIQDMVFELYDFVKSCPWPEEWLNDKAEEFNLSEDIDFSETKWAKIIIEYMKIELSGLLGSLKMAKSIIRTDESLSGYLEVFESDEIMLEEILRSCNMSWDEIYYKLSKLEFTKLSRCGKDADEYKKEKVKNIREDVKKRLRKIKDEIFMSISREIICNLKSLYPIMKCLSELVAEFDERYSAKKREKTLLDFNDLEHFCLKLLIEKESTGNIIPTQIAKQYRERFEEIYIDEYQDSNLVQEVILSVISRKEDGAPNLFMVGDVKQSIYRFRQARPELFMEKYNSFGNGSKDTERVIKLFNNFRSRKSVIDGANYIFKQIMSPNIGELEYNEDEELYPGADYKETKDDSVYAGGEIELHIVDVTRAKNANDEEASDVEDDNNENESNNVDNNYNDNYNANERISSFFGEDEASDMPDAIASEARIVARRINELFGKNNEGKSYVVFDKKEKKYRSIKFKDIVILLRTTKNWAECFVEELGAVGIPAYSDSGSGYFKTIEVQVMMSLLQIIDNPMQDIPLLSVLRSPIFAFTSEDLIDIRLVDRKISFYEAMIKMAESNNDKNNDKNRIESERVDNINVTTILYKVKSFLERLKIWRTKACDMYKDELLWYLYTDTGYYSYVGAISSGAQRQANLRILFQRAKQYEKTSYRGLFNFINFINKLKKSSNDLGSAKMIGESADVVRIMSIHKSKGLEFPVVFVSGVGKQFNLMDMNNSVLLHNELGFGPDLVDCEKRISFATVPKHALRIKILLESLSEEMRVLYVALTRARDKLIITGAIKNIRKSFVKWCSSIDASKDKIPEHYIIKSKSYLDWIGPSIARHAGVDAIRTIAGYEDRAIRDEEVKGLINDDSNWLVYTWDMNDVLDQKVINEINTEESSEADTEEKVVNSKNHSIEMSEDISLEISAELTPFYDEIEKRLNWKYPFSKSADISVKISVTELKRHFETELEGDYSFAGYVPKLIQKPQFLEETRGLSPAEKGTVMHTVMQHIRLDRLSTKQEILEQLDEMVKADIITNQQLKTVEIDKIMDFFDSDLGKRMLYSQKVLRELPFYMELKCTELYKDLSEEQYANENILLQGIIDCCFIEEDGIVLLDYKTDYVPLNGIEIIKNKYIVQIDYYTKALQRLTGLMVKERYIYLFYTGETVAM